MQKFVDSLLFLKDNYNISFTIKDFLNCIYPSPDGAILKKHFLIHDNNYCNMIKQVPEAFLHCVEISNFKLYQKIVNMEDPNEGFFGTSFCGVREFVMPLMYRGNVVGALLVGPFPAEMERKTSTMERISRIYGYDISILEHNYNKYIHANPTIAKELLSLIHLCVEYFNTKLDEYDSFANFTQHSKEHSILKNATFYIKLNLEQKIRIIDVARHCLCSESTLSHLFKHTFEVGVAQYIHNLRISKAKQMLQNKDVGLSMIAEKCGFSSKSHFSNSFKKATGMTALEYRSIYNN